MEEIGAYGLSPADIPVCMAALVRMMSHGGGAALAECHVELCSAKIWGVT
jgi:hypothetical protein